MGVAVLLISGSVTAMAATRDDPEFQAIIRKSNHGYMGPDWQPS